MDDGSKEGVNGGFDAEQSIRVGQIADRAIR